MAQAELLPTEPWDAIGEYLARTGQAPIPQLCKSCRAQMWWGYTRNQKRAPYDFTDGVFTNTPHFSTCPDSKSWRGRKRQP